MVRPPPTSIPTDTLVPYSTLYRSMWLDVAAATAIRDVCRARWLTASGNFQRRYSAMMLAVADAIARGQLGELVEIEVHLNLVTPWHLFPHRSEEHTSELQSLMRTSYAVF